jgi:Protein of unknown function (DUF2889)
MTPIEKLGHYLPNPDYGKGVARRRIHLRDDGATMVATLFDNFHEMRVELDHDGKLVTAARGGMRRFPKTTCPGAARQLSQLVGANIEEGRKAIRGLADRPNHCTHLLDLATYGVSMMQHGERERLFEISVTDRDAERRQAVEVVLNGKPALAFDLRNEIVEKPEQWAGCPIFGGFGRWVDEHFSGIEADLWLVAQMAVMISQGMAFLTDGPDPLPVNKGLHRKDACYTFSEPQFSVAWDNIGIVRDLTEGLPPIS